jgi:hypothetical protein
VIWKKADEAARDWCGGVSAKTLYAAVKTGKLKAARIGAGRNLLFCEEWCDEWLLKSEDVQRNAPGRKPEALQKHNGDRHAQSTEVGPSGANAA